MRGNSSLTSASSRGSRSTLWLSSCRKSGAFSMTGSPVLMPVSMPTKSVPASGLNLTDLPPTLLCTCAAILSSGVMPSFLNVSPAAISRTPGGASSDVIMNESSSSVPPLLTLATSRLSVFATGSHFLKSVASCVGGGKGS
jgi:hypothetical protein